MKSAATALLVILMLAGCGGGGGSGDGGPATVADAPSIPDTTSNGPTPTDDSADASRSPSSESPAPPPPSSRNEFPTLSEALATGADVSLYQRELRSSDSSLRLEPDLSFTIVGFAERDTFPVREGTQDGLTQYRSLDGTKTLLRSSPGEPSQGVTLDYMVYGAWTDRSVPFSDILRQGGVLYAGVSAFQPRGPSADFRRSGVATYRGGALALEHELAGDALTLVDTLSGSMTATADFDVSQVAIDLDFVDSSGQPWGAVSAPSLAINNTAISGRGNSSNGHVGNFSGNFWGPDSVEMGGTFLMLPTSRQSPNVVTGVFGATSR